MSEEEIMQEINKTIAFMKEELKAEHSCFTIKELWAIQGLLDLYNKEKEKNASLQKEIKLMKSININDNYISKDKIRKHLKKFEEIEKEFIFIYNKSTAREINKALIEFSKRLLEE